MVAAAAAVPAAGATTLPAGRTYVNVTVTGRTFTVGFGATAARGEWIIFHVRNAGTATARLTFLGRRSAPIAPHARGSLALYVTRRGAYPLAVSVGGRTLTRTFVVY